METRANYVIVGIFTVVAILAAFGFVYWTAAIGDKGENVEVAKYEGYDPLLFSIVHFFRTGVKPVTDEETIEIYAFMEAADESKRRGGAEVTLKEVMTKALAEARK